MAGRRTQDDHTGPVEDYLKVIYELERTSGTAATTDIAGRLSVAPASVSGMIRRLADQGLLRHERYRGVRLTREGRRVALNTIRRHRIIETFLVERLGYSWDRVHDEAERLEHAASDELIERMAAAVGEPTLDPHGAPIPTREGEIDEGDTIPLAELATGETARIVRVSDDVPALLRRLDEMGLTLGARLTVVAQSPEDATLTLRVEPGEEHTIDREVASILDVEPLATSG
jgi:DtxR family transcriptional regulator, Mn-dependent transcriptional regulator